MATIAILEHRFQHEIDNPYLAHFLAQAWKARGHEVFVQNGLPADPVPADLALMHVDVTVVPGPYREIAKSYPRVVNGAALDISKRNVSDGLLARGTDWDGEVIVKTDANYGGRIERRLVTVAARHGVPSDITPGPRLAYSVYPSPRAVPDAAWDTPGVVVEKFRPERETDGSYYLRVWTFFGDRERSNRYRAQDPLIKLDSVLGSEPVDVPDEIRAERERLGFDYGKFDYVKHAGRYVLLDANRTPGAPLRLLADPAARASFEGLAAGIDAFLS